MRANGRAKINANANAKWDTEAADNDTNNDD